jgi:hypothetical protein
MFLSAKKMSFLGLLLACAVLMVILSGILEFNTLFLLAGASFSVGIAIRESGLRFGFGFFIAGTLLSLILAPNKLYCITFAAMGLYLVSIEFAWEKLASTKGSRNMSKMFWVIKYVIFNVMYIPIILFLPKLIYPGKLNKGLVVVLMIGGQLALLIYDTAYSYFQKSIWGKLRGRLHL